MNHHHLLIKLLFLMSVNVLGAAVSANHELVLAAAAAGDLETVQSFCLDPNETTGKQSALYAALKHNKANTAYWLLGNGAAVGLDELIRAVLTSNRQLTFQVLTYAPDLRLSRRQKQALTEAAEKAKDSLVMGMLANKNLINRRPVNPRFLRKTLAPEKTKKQQTREEEVSLECVICLESLTVQQDGQSFFSCSHDSQYFHTACIEQSIQTNKTCPLCRARIKHT